MRVAVVTSPFAGHSRGEVIRDQAEIDEILAGESAHSVIVSDHPDDPTPPSIMPVKKSKSSTQSE
jgi:hypothetical protein